MPYILKLQVVNKDVLPYYEEQIAKRVESAKTNPLMDSGFDLYCPEDVVFEYDSNFTKQYCRTKLVDLGIKAAAYEVRNFKNFGVFSCTYYGNWFSINFETVEVLSSKYIMSKNKGWFLVYNHQLS